MRTFNQVILVGHLGRDAETKYTASGTPLTTFSIATNRRVKGQGDEWRDETDWHNCVLWKNENLVPYLVKGKAVFLEGRLHTRSWDKDGEKRYSTEVVVETVLLMGDRGETAAPAPLVSAPRKATAQPNDLGITDDDIPF